MHFNLKSLYVKLQRLRSINVNSSQKRKQNPTSYVLPYDNTLLLLRIAFKRHRSYETLKNKTNDQYFIMSTTHNLAQHNDERFIGS